MKYVQLAALKSLPCAGAVQRERKCHHVNYVLFVCSPCVQTLYNVSGNAPMLGVVVAMETFCGQAYGAKKYQTVGVVLQVCVWGGGGGGLGRVCGQA